MLQNWKLIFNGQKKMLQNAFDAYGQNVHFREAGYQQIRTQINDWTSLVEKQFSHNPGNPYQSVERITTLYSPFSPQVRKFTLSIRNDYQRWFDHTKETALTIDQTIQQVFQYEKEIARIFRDRETKKDEIGAEIISEVLATSQPPKLEVHSTQPEKKTRKKRTRKTETSDTKQVDSVQTAIEGGMKETVVAEAMTEPGDPSVKPEAVETQENAQMKLPNSQNAPASAENVHISENEMLHSNEEFKSQETTQPDISVVEEPVENTQ